MITQQEFAALYNRIYLSYNPRSQTGISNTDLFFRANTLGGMLALQSNDINNAKQNIFIKGQSGTLLDSSLAAYKLPPRSAGVYATGNVTLLAIQATDTIFEANTLLSIGNLTYYVQETTIVIAGDLGLIPIQSSNIGSGQQLAPATQLNLVQPIGNVSKVAVVSMNDGQGQETDAQVKARLDVFTQNTPLGGTLADYAIWASRNQPAVTGVYVVYNLPGQMQIVSVFILSGTNDPDIILANPSIPYYRTSTNSDISTTLSKFIEPYRPINNLVYASTTNTQLYTAPNTVEVQVALVSNISLSTYLDEYNMTVQQLICREVRRAFITQPFFGQQESEGLLLGRYIPLNDIVNSLNAGLLAPNGIYAQIALNFKVTYLGTSEDIPINTELDNQRRLNLVYDIIYDAINITTF